MFTSEPKKATLSSRKSEIVEDATEIPGIFHAIIVIRFPRSSINTCRFGDMREKYFRREGDRSSSA